MFLLQNESGGKSAPLQERARRERVLRREPPVRVDGQQSLQQFVQVAVGLAVLAEGRHAPHVVSTVPVQGLLPRASRVAVEVFRRIPTTLHQRPGKRSHGPFYEREVFGVAMRREEQLT